MVSIPVFQTRTLRLWKGEYLGWVDMTGKLSGRASQVSSPEVSYCLYKYVLKKTLRNDHNYCQACIIKWIHVCWDSDHTPGNITAGTKVWHEAGLLVTSNARTTERSCQYRWPWYPQSRWPHENQGIHLDHGLPPHAQVSATVASRPKESHT